MLLGNNLSKYLLYSVGEILLVIKEIMVGLKEYCRAVNTV